MKNALLKKKEELIAVLMIAFLYLLFHVLGVGCPIKFLTGVSCPGCGMTRAMWSLLHLNFGRAFYYHPLWPLPFLWIVNYLFRKRLGKAYRYINIAFAVIFIAVYLIRMFTGPREVVTFEPENGAVVRAFKYIAGL